MAKQRSPNPEGTALSPRFKQRNGQATRQQPQKRRPDQSLTETILLKLGIEDGRVIACLNDASTNLAILRGLVVRKFSKPLSEKLIKGINRIIPLMEARNLVAHGIWGTTLPENLPGVLALRKKPPNLDLLYGRVSPRNTYAI